MIKYPLILIYITLLLSCFKDKEGGDSVTGTATDVNTYSIHGSISLGGEEYAYPVAVELYSTGSDTRSLAKASEEPGPIQKQSTSIGNYKFDDLSPGRYAIKIIHDGVLIGEERGIDLTDERSKEVNIVVVIIINQIFNIYIDSSKNIRINNFNIINGGVEEISRGKYRLKFTEGERKILEIEIEEDGTTSKIDVEIIKGKDDAYSLVPVKQYAHIDIISEATIIPYKIGNSASAIVEGEVKEEVMP